MYKLRVHKHGDATDYATVNATVHAGGGVGFEFETDYFRLYPSKLIYSKLWVTGLFTTSATLALEVSACSQLRVCICLS
jgi:hypothetical protein